MSSANAARRLFPAVPTKINSPSPWDGSWTAFHSPSKPHCHFVDPRKIKAGRISGALTRHPFEWFVRRKREFARIPSSALSGQTRISDQARLRGGEGGIRIRLETQIQQHARPRMARKYMKSSVGFVNGLRIGLPLPTQLERGISFSVARCCLATPPGLTTRHGIAHRNHTPRDVRWRMRLPHCPVVCSRYYHSFRAAFPILTFHKPGISSVFTIEIWKGGRLRDGC